MDRPVIGVVPLFDSERNSYWMIPGYMRGLEAAGGLPVMLPLTTDRAEISQLAKLCGGILFTGGQDVSPAIYGEKASPLCGEICDDRDNMERELLRLAVENDIPSLGICRGIQFMNVALGGSLYQDLPAEYPSQTDHHMSPPYDRVCHRVDIVKGTPLHELLKKDVLGVNSYHHQAVKRTAHCLREMAYSEDGLTEAVYMPGRRFIWAVQWHPELSYQSDADSMAILSAFVSAAK